jgi:uncharacterized membrane protein
MTPQASVQTRVRRRMPWLVGITVGVLILIVLAFAVWRLVVDVSNLAAGTMPNDEYDARFVRHPWLTYLYIVPGVLYMVGATLQLAYWFRRCHYTFHRRLGRVLLAAGLITGLLAVALGLAFPFGGLAELSATVLFGAWFLGCLLLAFRAVRAGDIVQHRRWMIRAFAIGRRGRHDPHLDSGVPDQRAAQLFSSSRSGVLDLLHAARSHRRALAARSPAATGNDRRSSGSHYGEVRPPPRRTSRYFLAPRDSWD